MRKVLFFSLTILLSAFLYACGTMMGAKASEEARRFEKVIDIPNLSKSDIYIKANAWFVETFNSAESVIEFQDKESGKIMGKYVFSYAEGVYTYDVRQTISIDIKDGKVRIVINDPYFRTTSGMGQKYYDAKYTPLVTLAGINRATEKWTELSNSLASYLNTTNDNW
jgi:hypothetical protein